MSLACGLMVPICKGLRASTLLLVQRGSHSYCVGATAGDNTFACTKSYSRKTGEFGEPPAELRAPRAADKGKGKGAAASSAPAVEAPAVDDECEPAMHIT